MIEAVGQDIGGSVGRRARRRVAARSALGGQHSRSARRFRPLVVGEAPSRTSDQRRPIGGRCGDRLAEFADLSVAEFRRRVARANLLGAWPGASGPKGATFPLAEARSRAVGLRRRFVGGRTVVLLGKRVGSAFRVSTDYFEPIVVGRARIVVVPHPSGVNRWYNEPSNVARMRAFMRGLLVGGSHGS